MSLPSGFFKRPFAHRGLHGSARPENSREAIAAAVAQGFGIELDVQMSRDGRAMVFHDYGLARLTGESGTVQTTDAERLAALPLIGGQTGAPPLEDILAAVAGRVPLLIEIKDQDGALGPDIGRLEDAVATALSGYAGPLAVMSFNPHSVAAMAALAPQVPRGIVTCAFAAEAWPSVSEARRAELARIPDFERVGASFISHHHVDLANPAVAGLKARGASILCWTIRSPEEARAARAIADQITFEGYHPA